MYDVNCSCLPEGPRIQKKTLVMLCSQPVRIAGRVPQNLPTPELPMIEGHEEILLVGPLIRSAHLENSSGMQGHMNFGGILDRVTLALERQRR